MSRQEASSAASFDESPEERDQRRRERADKARPNVSMTPGQAETLAKSAATTWVCSPHGNRVVQENEPQGSCRDADRCACTWTWVESAPPELAILDRTRERANRILGQNASNSAKALAKDALELCAMVDDFRAELREPTVLNRVRRMIGV